MADLFLSCQIFQTEYEFLAKEGVPLPRAIFLEPELHNQPDKLRAYVQNTLDTFEAEFEAQHPGKQPVVLMGYGLCGRGLCGVRAKKSLLVFPRVHDCISLLLGQEHTKENALTREGAIYWSSPGMIRYFQENLHLNYHKRFALYVEKFGQAKAERMKKAELALYKNYHTLGYIYWPELRGQFEDQARAVAASLDIPYSEYPGSSAFMRELFADHFPENFSPARFLCLEPGQTIDMDLDGMVVATS